MKFALGCIFYNDRAGLKRLLESVYNGFDIMFCIDGKFPDYNEQENSDNNTLLSSDGSREIVREFDNAILYDKPTAEVEKRQEYLNLCEKHNMDYLCILDADEYAEKSDKESWDNYRKKIVETVEVKHGSRHNIFSIYMQVASKAYDEVTPYKDIWLKENNIEYGQYPRIWYKPSSLEYAKGIHYFWHKKDPKEYDYYAVQMPSREIIDGIRFRHDHLLRTLQHQKARREYQIILMSNERKLL